MKVSFSPDIIHSGWLGSKHQLTNYLITEEAGELYMSEREKLSKHMGTATLLSNFTSMGRALSPGNMLISCHG